MLAQEPAGRGEMLNPKQKPVTLSIGFSAMLLSLLTFALFQKVLINQIVSAFNMKFAALAKSPEAYPLATFL
jgi:hypothetical protein